MNTSGASKVLPIILTAITLATAVFFYNQREVLRQKTQELLNRPAKQTAAKLPDPTPTQSLTPTPSVANPPLAETPTPKTELSLAKRDLASPDTICTPVYGMANTCAEHAVVDTALDTSIFYNLAGMSYVLGLAAFIKAKKRS